MTSGASQSWSPGPRVSVVVPVRDRRSLLGRLLDSLDAQTYRDVEVIVVDDGSTDGSGALGASRRVAGAPVRVLCGAGQGAVAARRLGVAVARGAILAFTDSDCEPVPGWLAATVAAIDAGADLAHGPTVPARPVGPLERSVTAGDEGLYPSCNLVVRREAFDAVGGFDPAAAQRLGFRHDRRARGLGFGEDTLLAWRVRRRGPVTFVPEAVVHHHVFAPDPLETLSRHWMAGAFPALVRDVPELGSTLLELGVFLGRRRLPLYLVLAAMAARRRRLAALATAGWAAVRLAEQRQAPGTWRARLAALPLEMAGDATATAALAAGSLRARRLVL